MKLIDAIKQKGKPYRVPNCSRDDLPELFVELGYKVGAEIGVLEGDFTEKFCQDGLSVHAIDPWINRDPMHKRVVNRLGKYKNCNVVRKTSLEAVNDFRARSLDFVYIDGDHRFPFVAEDLYYWWWRIKRGGMMAGHDYLDTRPDGKPRSIQIQSVVDAFVKAFGIENFYIFGRSKPLSKEAKDDKVLSFMFFRK